MKQFVDAAPQTSVTECAKDVGGPPDPRLIALVLVLVGLVIISLRSIAVDEAYSWGLVSLESWERTRAGIRYTNGNMLVYFAMLKAVVGVSDDLVVMRLPSLLFAIGTVLVLIQVADEWFDRRTAWFVGFLGSTSVPLTYYAVEVRSYSLVALASVLLWHRAARAFEADRRVDWLLVGVFGGLAVSAHIIMIFALPWVVLAAWLERGRRSIPGLTLRFVPMGLFVAPTAALVLTGGGSQVGWIPPVGPGTIGRALRLLAGDHAQLSPLLIGPLVNVLYAAVFLFAFWWLLEHGGWRSPARMRTWLWFVGLPLTVTVVSLVEHLLWHRYLIGALPGGLLVAASTLARLDRRTGRIVVALLAGLSLLRTGVLAPHSNDEFDDLAAFFEERAEPDDALVAVTPWNRVGLDYLWHDEGAPLRGDRAFAADFNQGGDFRGFEWMGRPERFWLLNRAFAGQVWIDQDRPASDFEFDEVEDLIPPGYVLESEFDVHRFRIRLYVLEGE